MGERRATLKVCDACGAEHEHSRDEYAYGIHLKGVAHIGGGGGPLKVYACSFECLGLAAEVAYARMWDEDWEVKDSKLAARVAEAHSDRFR